MLVFDKGNKISLKNRMGPAPSIRAASINSLGIVKKNCRNKKVAVAEAIKGKVRPAYVLTKPKLATTSNVGEIRTSTGNIKVIKISQKHSMRNGNLK